MNLSGSPLDYLIAFAGGVAAGFTPCVYPLIPIVLGYIGIKSEDSKIKALSLSLVYVTGIAVTYSILGLIASLTGTIFGRISSSAAAKFIAGVMIILFGLSMLDLFRLPLPSFRENFIYKKKSYLHTFILGLSSGLLVSPCLTPVLGSILLYLATKKNMLYGITLLFSFAYGMGLLLIIIATFSATLAGLPKSGKWMVYVKRIYALILLGAGVYFIYLSIWRR